MKDQNTIVAIDGFSSCGKSTLALALSRKLHFLYVDSGAMYRAITLYFLRHNTDLNDQALVRELLDRDIHITFEKVDSRMIVLLNNEDVSDEIRDMRVSELVSRASAIRTVRTKMVHLQQKLGRTKNLVMDGRDIGTTVFPLAHLKIFMTADLEVRARRRFLELQSKGKTISIHEIAENLKNRDFQDTTRPESPLKQARDTVVLDNTFLTEAEQLEFVLNVMQERTLLPAN